MTVSSNSRARACALLQAALYLAEQEGIDPSEVSRASENQTDVFSALLMYGASRGQRLDMSARTDIMRDMNTPTVLLGNRHDLEHSPISAQLIARGSLTKGRL